MSTWLLRVHVYGKDAQSFGKGRGVFIRTHIVCRLLACNERKKTILTFCWTKNGTLLLIIHFSLFPKLPHDWILGRFLTLERPHDAREQEKKNERRSNLNIRWENNCTWPKKVVLKTISGSLSIIMEMISKSWRNFLAIRCWPVRQDKVIYLQRAEHDQCEQESFHQEYNYTGIPCPLLCTLFIDGRALRTELMYSFVARLTFSVAVEVMGKGDFRIRERKICSRSGTTTFYGKPIN